MRGQNAILQMRMGGYRPALVWLLVLDSECPRRRHLDAETTLQESPMPEIHVGMEDNPAELDLRVLVDLTVLLQGMDRNRVRAVFTRLKSFDPARVVVSGADFFHDYSPQKDSA
ncbi:hypothetical protein RE432_14915 [Pusillimonas sp. SM2304]|uniref:hypothetical protein n=1 Tax=Pusillimonas sp. SM2304 TaxID=3073241 RepID=UPI00287657D3|nr:hypothetical protein [Pusillimonas sp. SM2304]MDS1141730.1 hypothetical protein [Pusillimonas sp. SM2304]